MLDSDLNAMTDALHERLRSLANHLGCPQGSPDLGYLVTPGRLLALFRELDGVVTVSGGVTWHRDYQQKYLDRYPSLYLHADQGVAGSATIQLRAEANGDTVFWCRSDVATQVSAGGVPLNAPAGPNLQAVVITLPQMPQLQIDLNAGDEIWIGLIERFQAATSAPVFHYAAGHYYLNGLPLINPDDTAWVANLIPAAAPNLVSGQRLLAYLEGWEHHVTFVEDLGILEHALGGDTDTTTRGRAVGQVKLALVPADFDLDAFSQALYDPVVSGGTLDVTTPPAAPDPDPCALPAQGGYTGPDNRLYRIEVHTGGVLGTAVFKWSRDNGAELFPVIAATNQELTFPANTLLQPGDFVEVLTADTIELGDAGLALLTGPNSFEPAARAVGRLVQLQAAASNETGVTFTLLEPDGISPVVLSAAFVPPLKVRRWHGLIETVGGQAEYAVENGIEVEIDGSFSPGDYWQYEARSAGDNANGPFQVAPHGPERDYAPLALLQVPVNVASQPLMLEQWLDERFPPLCGLTADDIAFDGDRIGSESDTVQEAIEELWERVGGGCCEFTLEPHAGNTTAVVAEILQSTAGEVTICFLPGIYTFTSVLDITNRKVTLKGCPRAVLVAGGTNVMLRVGNNGRLELADLILFGRQDEGARVLVEMPGESASLEAYAVGLFIMPNAADPNALPTVAVLQGGQEPSAVDLLNPVPLDLGQLPSAGPMVRLDSCHVAASWGVSASSLEGLAIEHSLFSCLIGCVSVWSLVNVSLNASDFVAGVNLNVLQSWSPGELLAHADARIDTLQGILNLDAVAAASIGIRVLNCILASIVECRLVAGIGIAMTQARIVHLQGNVYATSRLAIYFVRAEQSLISGEEILQYQDLNDAQNAPIAIQLLLAGGLSITDCAISQFRIGIALGAESAGQAVRRFESLQIQNNQIDDVEIGILLGTSDLNSYPVEMLHAAITENTIRSQLVGILVNAQGVPSGGAGQGARPALVRVADNTITARLGIGASGGPIEVTDNLVRMVAGGGARYGVMALNTADLVCDGNHIEFAAAAGPGDLIYSATLQIAAVAMAGTFGAYLAAVGAVPPAAILVMSGSTARVSAR